MWLARTWREALPRPPSCSTAGSDRASGSSSPSLREPCSSRPLAPAPLCSRQRPSVFMRRANSSRSAHSSSTSRPSATRAPKRSAWCAAARFEPPRLKRNEPTATRAARVSCRAPGGRRNSSALRRLRAGILRTCLRLAPFARIALYHAPPRQPNKKHCPALLREKHRPAWPIQTEHSRARCSCPRTAAHLSWPSAFSPNA